MAATSAPAKLGTANRDHLDPRFAEECVRVDIAVIGHDDPGLERHHVVAVIPLLPLCLPRIATGFDDAEILEIQCLFDDVEDWLFSSRTSIPSAWFDG